jgi:hypothetical protein
MSYKSFCSFLLFFLISFSALGQKTKVQFQSINNIGTVFGESQPHWVFQSVNGIKSGNWFVGAGIGLDDYVYQTMPLFFDGRRYFGKEKKGFLYANVGYDFPLKNKPGKEIYYYSSSHFSGGIYTDFGIGVESRLSKKTSLVFSIGHSYKELTNKIGASTCGIVGPCWVEYSTYKYNFGRIALKAGVIF